MAFYQPIPDEYDNYVTAELPDIRKQPRLFHIVASSLIHGPCGPACKKDGRCSKRFPRQPADRTSAVEDGYVEYRRRPPPYETEMNVTIELGEGQSKTYRVGPKGVLLNRRWVDNTWVVPYNPALTLKYNAHINVELCATVKSVKYLYKYVYKGGDRTVAGITEEGEGDDEITTYVDARYLGSCEAAWRIFNFGLSARYPSVMHLAVHEPDGQYVMFTPATAQQVLSSGTATTLTAYFAKNAEVGSDDPVRQTLYHNFPSHFTWDAKTKTWKDRRRQTGQIGRMYTVHPSAGERFYIRLLLCHVAGATSFEELRTLDDGEVCETFHQACCRRLLVQNDDEWNRCLEDAIITHTSVAALRQLFVTLLRCCQVQQPLLLWNHHRDELAADFLHQARQTDLQAQMNENLRNLALLDIDRSLRSVGSSAAQYGLPEPQDVAETNVNQEIPVEIRDEPQNVDRQQLQRDAAANVARLNDDQRRAYDAIMGAQSRLFTDVSSVSGLWSEDGGGRHTSHSATRWLPAAGERWDGFFFVDGPGGTGKTFLYETLISAIRGMGRIVVAAASSGVASTLLPRGRTAHSAFGIPINVKEGQSCCIVKESGRAQLLRTADVIFWDEAPMAHRHCHEALERTLRDICGIDMPWGGKIVVMGGDFRQVRPCSSATIVSAHTPPSSA